MRTILSARAHVPDIETFPDFSPNAPISGNLPAFTWHTSSGICLQKIVPLRQQHAMVIHTWHLDSCHLCQSAVARTVIPISVLWNINGNESSFLSWYTPLIYSGIHCSTKNDSVFQTLQNFQIVREDFHCSKTMCG